MSLFLLDTNIISELARNKPNQKVLSFLESLNELCISAITIEEIEFGVAKASVKYQYYLYEWWNSFLNIPPVIIPIDIQISRLAGDIRAKLAKKGKQISQADAFIAATSLDYKRILVTRNVKDFQSLELQILNPFS